MRSKLSSIVSLKSLLIMYLAISKIQYWIEVVRGMWEAEAIVAIDILNRVTNRDLLIVMVAICFLAIDSSEGNIIKKLVLGYLITVVGYTIYLLAMRTLLGLFFTLTEPTWWVVYLNFTINFFVAGIVLHIKKYAAKRYEEKENSQQKEPICRPK